MSVDWSPDGRWGRGRRGWESTPVTYPNPTPTTFQQHPESYTSDEDREGEAAADMFLNWVYSAFQNITWKPRDIRKTNSCPGFEADRGCLSTHPQLGGNPGNARQS